MKVSAKARYALRLLVDLALYADRLKPRTIRQMSEAQQISEKFISKLVVPMRNAGMIASVRGVQGGFLLAREPSQITLLEVVETLDGPVEIVESLAQAPSGDKPVLSMTRSAWKRVNSSLREMMAAVTLHDVLKGSGQGAI